MSRHVFALIDESGSLPDPKDPILVVGIIVATDTERQLERLLAKIRRSLPGKGKRKNERRISELKFRLTSPKTRRQVLIALAKEPVAIFVLVVDKGGQSIADTPDNYATIVNLIVPECLKRNPDLQKIVFDRHFSRRADLDRMTHLILTRLQRDITVEYADSLQDPRIDLADFVAGAVVYARRRGDTIYEDLIRERIEVYQTVRWEEKEKW